MGRCIFFLAPALWALLFPSLAAPADVVLTAKLSGKYLHASPTGSGTAKITLQENRVCWQFTFKGLDKLAESGIHQAPPPAAGKRKHSVIPFKALTTRKGCAQANAGQIQAVIANPGSYYVDIHTVKYPAGAIGGRLRQA